MQIIYKTFMKSLFLWAVLLCSFQAEAQFGSYNKRPNLNISPNVNGLVDYLPSGYDPNGTQRYPLLIFIMGIGSTGSGSLADLDNLFTGTAGLPTDQFQDGTWVEEYTVNGQSYKFIVIAPQFITPFDIADPSPADMDAIIDYAIDNYKVDTTRIYLTGNSSGGGPVVNYAGADSTGALGYGKRIAAIVPFSAAYLSTVPTQAKADVYRNNNIAVWAFHNTDDPGVPAYYTQLFVDLINSPSPPPIPAKITLFPPPSWGPHDSWYGPYTRTYTENGMNIYEWMLQYSRTFTVLPVSFTLFNASCSNGAVKLTWKTGAEKNSKEFNVERSENGSDWNSIGTIAAAGQSEVERTYHFTDHSGGNAAFYRIAEISLDGKTSYSVALRSNCSGSELLALYPNPVYDEAVLSIDLKQNARVKYLILDSKGAVVRQDEKLLPSGTSQLSIDLGALPRGSYTLNASWGAGSQSVKFIKN